VTHPVGVAGGLGNRGGCLGLLKVLFPAVTIVATWPRPTATPATTTTGVPAPAAWATSAAKVPATMELRASMKTLVLASTWLNVDRGHPMR
jgi:hypothetical protein